MWPFPDLTLQVLSQFQRALQFDLDAQFCVVGILSRWAGPTCSLGCVFDGNRMSLGKVVYDIELRWLANARIVVRSVKIIPGIPADAILREAVRELLESPSGPKKLRSVRTRRVYDEPTFWCRLPGHFFRREDVDGNVSLKLSCDTVADRIGSYFPGSAIARILTFLLEDQFRNHALYCDFWRKRGISMEDAIDVSAWHRTIDESISEDLERSDWLQHSLFSEIQRQELADDGKSLSKLHCQRLLVDLLESLPSRRRGIKEDDIDVQIVAPVTNNDQGLSVLQFEERLISDTERQLQRNHQNALRLCSEATGVSLRDLAMQLGEGASSFGLKAILIREAYEQGCLREVLMDLLAERIRAWFPSGYHADSSISPAAAAASWQSAIEKKVDDDRIHQCTRSVVRYLREDVPPGDWFPLSAEDPVLAAIFEQCWPKNSGR